MPDPEYADADALEQLFAIDPDIDEPATATVRKDEFAYARVRSGLRESAPDVGRFD